MTFRFSYFIFTLFLLITGTSFSQNGIVITDNEGHNADGSAVLDIYSTSKGVLVPRMSTAQINAISNPTTGLLVFNNTLQSFWFYTGTQWDDLSTGSSGLWSLNNTTGEVYLKNIENNVGIGTNNPVGKLSVVGNPGSNPDSPLFEVKDEFGFPIFSVSSEGVRVYIKDVTKGTTGGFAVGRYGIAKGVPDTSFLIVTPDSARIYLQEGEKGAAGGFAVGRYGIAKGNANTIFYTGVDSTRVYTDVNQKGVAGGFAVGRYGIAKGTQNYLHMTDNNYLIGHRAGENMLPGGTSNIFLGYESGFSNQIGSRNTFLGHNSGHSNVEGMNNIFIGDSAGYSCIESDYNIFIGNSAGFHTNSDEYPYGSENVFIGTFAGYENIDGLDNVYIGNKSGKDNRGGNSNVFIGGYSGQANSKSNNIFIGGASFYQNTTGNYNTAVGSMTGVLNITGVGNVFLGYKAGYNETGSNKLYIENSDNNLTQALIYGDFEYDILRLNANVGIGALPAYKLDVVADVASNYAARFFNDGNDENRYGIIIQTGSDLGSTTGYNGYYISFRDGNGTALGLIYSTDGNMVYGLKSAIGNEHGIQTSKQNVSDLLSHIKIVDYYPSEESKRIVTGFTNDNLMDVYPQSINFDPGSNQYFTNFSTFIPILIKAHQEQEDRILKLEKENSELKLKIEDIINQLKK
jgi:hypothetical protein